MNCVSLLKDGKDFIQNKQYTLAENLFTNVISLLEKERDSRSIQMMCEAYNNLGYICYRKVEFNKAMKYYNEAINLNTSYGISYYNRGTIYYRLGFYEYAVKDMEKAILFEPNNEEFKIGLEESKFALKLKSVEK